MEELRYLSLELLRLPGYSVLERRRLGAFTRTVDQARRRFIQAVVRELLPGRRTIRIFDLQVTSFLLSMGPLLKLHLIGIIDVGLCVTLISFARVEVASHRV